MLFGAQSSLEGARLLAGISADVVRLPVATRTPAQAELGRGTLGAGAVVRVTGSLRRGAHLNGGKDPALLAFSGCPLRLDLDYPGFTA